MTELSFLQPKENLIFMGAVGTGKTHLATAIALKACQEGRRVRFFTAAELANILLERNTKGTLNNFLNSLKKAELIVIDEIGFVPLHKDAAELYDRGRTQSFTQLDCRRQFAVRQSFSVRR